MLVDRGNPTEFLTVLSERLEHVSPRSSGWQARWLRAALATGTTLKKHLSAEQATNPVGELSAVFAVLRALPPSSRLVIGNSLPIRHVDFVAICSQDPVKNKPIYVEALRGASGADDRPTTLLIGDLSFLHDVGALWSAQSVDAALAIVVLNNGGGRIFEQLPIGRSTSEEELRHFTTPHQCDLSHASALFGLPHLRVSSVHGIKDALSEAHSHPGATVIEIVVAPSSSIDQTVQSVAAVKDELVRVGLLSSEAAKSG
jgi:2-succinyl-5-enolpyruvyl-6-hydroxy-3-cyclohexene-1-carboxylate synthase